LAVLTSIISTTNDSFLPIDVLETKLSLSFVKTEIIPSSLFSKLANFSTELLILTKEFLLSLVVITKVSSLT